MRLKRTVIVSLLCALTGCSDGKAPATEPQQESPPGAEMTGGAAPEVGQDKFVVDDAVITHMHAHADRLDELNFALADGDLAGAMTHAYWLSQHDEIAGMPVEWQKYIDGVREAAQAVEAAEDLETARAAAERINESCQGCHDAAGVASQR